MAAKRTKTSLQDALQGHFPQKGQSELRSDVKALYERLSGYERVTAIIERVQRYAVETVGISVNRDLGDLDADEVQEIEAEAVEIEDTVRRELLLCVTGFISDAHREFVVRCHACGLSTSDAVQELILGDNTINRLAQDDAMGWKGLREILIHRLAYLKPGSARWPEAKYGALWRETREQHRQAVSDIPFTSPVEQIALLAKHADRINRELEKKTHSAKDLQLLTNSLTKTMESLRRLSATEQPMPVNLSGAQIVGVLERLTLALKAPGKQMIGGEAEDLVSVLERLTLALKAPEQKVIGNGTKVLPAEPGVSVGEHE